jgi:hypothetical protein
VTAGHRDAAKPEQRDAAKQNKRIHKITTIKLRKEVTAEQTGMIKNSVELGDVYNTQGVEDINSKVANKDSSENDYSEALVVIALSTGGNIIKVAGAIFGVLALGVVILSIAKVKRKKKII